MLLPTREHTSWENEARIALIAKVDILIYAIGVQREACLTTHQTGAAKNSAIDCSN